MGDAQTVVSLEVDDVGYCSSYTQKYMVHASWGVHLVNSQADYLPTVQTVGTVAAHNEQHFKWFFKPASTNTYYLWLYIPPWPTCNNGTIARPHTVNVVTQVSRMARSNFNPTTPPVFTGQNAGDIGASRLAVEAFVSKGEVNVMLHRNETKYSWISNQNPALNQPNDLTVLLGKFSVDMVVDVDIGDEG